VVGEVDVERPAPECQPSAVVLQLGAQPGNATRPGRLRCAAAASLPLHGRYPAPHASRLAAVELPLPRLLLRCNGGPWRPAAPPPAALAPPLALHLPAGDPAVAGGVERVTAAVFCTGILATLARLLLLPTADDEKEV